MELISWAACLFPRVRCMCEEPPAWHGSIEEEPHDHWADLHEPENWAVDLVHLMWAE